MVERHFSSKMKRKSRDWDSTLELSRHAGCPTDMGTGITNVIGGPHDFLPPWSDRFDEFQKLWYFCLGQE
jgi:hypothetical protein